jgi:choline dehydrogenase
MTGARKSATDEARVAPHTKVLHRHSHSDLPVAALGDGAWVVDTAGKRYLDASGGAAVSCLGHSDPDVIAAIQDQVARLPFAHTAFFTNTPQEELAERMVAGAPEGLERVYFTSGGSEAIEAGMALRYAFGQRGMMAMPPVPTGGFFRSDPSLASPDIQTHIVLFSTSGKSGKQGAELHDFPGMSSTVILLRPESRGAVEIASADPADAPLIKSRYLDSERDRQALMRGVREVRRIMRQPALEPFVGEEIEPGDDVVSDDDMIEYLRNFGNTGFHPTSTCRMGVDATAVVDPRLRVHGFEGLRVVDASVMPAVTSGNTNAPTFMIAEKGADMIREDARGG